MLGEANIPDTIVKSIYPLLGVVSVIGRLLAGYLTDRISNRFVMTVGLSLQAMGLFFIPLMIASGSNAFAFLVAVFMGMSGSFTSNVRSESILINPA